ncbi:asparagine synthetase B, partial [Streptomyces turgidiscabies]
PDDEGCYSDTGAVPVHLGFRRLSILDLALGQQPMATTEGDLVVVFNGEIYNHLDLRRALTALGHRFRTDHSDTEVLL